MLLSVLLDRPVELSYHSVSVGPADIEGGGGGEPWRGQANGLCGAAVPGWLTLITGIHTGVTPFRVELHSDEPLPGDRWEEVVEASFLAPEGHLALAGLLGGARPIALPAGPYRVRYCARGMQQGHDQDTATLATMADSYLLQFWPAAPGPDRILRQTSRIAAYRHEHSPTPEPTARQVAVRRERQRAAAEREEAEAQRAEDREMWGNRRPSDRLRAAAERANPLQWLDARLPHALAEVDDDRLRAIAWWAAERAATVAALTELPWVAEALRTVRLPPPFDPSLPYQAEVWTSLDPVPITTVRLPDDHHTAGARPETSQQHAALSAFFATADPDPLTGAINAVHAAAGAHGQNGYRHFLAELRRAFPELRPVRNGSGTSDPTVSP